MSRPGLVLAVAATVLLAVLLAATDWETPRAGRSSGLPVVPAAAGPAPRAVGAPVVLEPAAVPETVVVQMPVVAPSVASAAAAVPLLPELRPAPRQGLAGPAARPAPARPVPPVVAEARRVDRPAAPERAPSAVRSSVRVTAPQRAATQQVRSIVAARRPAAPAPGAKALEAPPASRPPATAGTVNERPAVRAVAPEPGRVEAARAGLPVQAIVTAPAAAPAAFELAPAPLAPEPPAPSLVRLPDPEVPQPDPRLPPAPVSREGKDDPRPKGRDDEEGGRDKSGKSGGDDGDDD